jgi:hypothetical protein
MTHFVIQLTHIMMSSREFRARKICWNWELPISCVDMTQFVFQLTRMLSREETRQFLRVQKFRVQKIHRKWELPISCQCVIMTQFCNSIDSYVVQGRNQSFSSSNVSQEMEDVDIYVSVKNINTLMT